MLANNVHRREHSCPQWVLIRLLSNIFVADGIELVFPGHQLRRFANRGDIDVAEDGEIVVWRRRLRARDAAEHENAQTNGGKTIHALTSLSRARSAAK